MKILIFINSLGAGGAERSMVELAKFLKDTDGIVVKFVCLQRRSIGLEAEVAQYGIETRFFNRENGSWWNKVEFFNEIIKEEKPDILHSVLAESNLILRLTRLFNNKGRVIQSLVNTPYSEERKKDRNLSWRKMWVMKQIDKWSARLSGSIFYHAITQEVLEHYRPLFNIKNNYEVIYRGRNINKHLYNGKNANFTVINSGRQEFAKGQIDILEALVYLRENYKVTNIKLEILGREGAHSKKLKNYISENKLEGQVIMHGFINNVEERLAKAHAFIFPSYYEGLGGALIEAFAAKLPCICSNLPVLEEVVGNKQRALFCAPGDYKCLAQQMLKLYKDEDLRKKLGNHSFARFEDKFQLENINRQMLSLYRNLLAP